MIGLEFQQNPMNYSRNELYSELEPSLSLGIITNVQINSRLDVHLYVQQTLTLELYLVQEPELVKPSLTLCHCPPLSRRQKRGKEEHQNNWLLIMALPLWKAGTPMNELTKCSASRDKPVYGHLHVVLQESESSLEMENCPLLIGRLFYLYLELKNVGWCLG